MTIIRMRIGVRDGHPHYEYPPSYRAELINHGWGPIYEAGLDNNANLARERRLENHSSGVGYEYILFGVRDQDAPVFLAANGTTLRVDGVEVPITAEVVNRETAINEHKNWVGPQTEKITDQKVVDRVILKRAKGEALTPEEVKAVDPTDPTPGINLTKSFEETLDEALDTVK